MEHVPVLLQESVGGLLLEAGDIVVDATLGAGGHSSEIARRFGSAVRIFGFDMDSSAIAKAQKAVLAHDGNLTAINSNFRNMERELEDRGVAMIQGALFDLGVSSMELGASGRGFSFKYDEPLLMTLGDSLDEALTARDILASTPEEELANIIFKYGQERFSRRIAKAIAIARRKEKIETTFGLVRIIEDAVPGFYRNGRIHPATRTFQALRIATNDELGALEEGIASAWKLLEPGSRMAVITFHSLEDRIVKNFFRQKSQAGQGQLVNKKPIVPSREELLANPRSRSAKLRIIEKI